MTEVCKVVAHFVGNIFGIPSHSVDVLRFSFFKTCLTRPMFDVDVIVLKTTPPIRSITVCPLLTR